MSGLSLWSMPIIVYLLGRVSNQPFVIKAQHAAMESKRQFKLQFHLTSLMQGEMDTIANLLNTIDTNSLLSAMIGGLIVVVSQLVIENRKWSHQRKVNLGVEKRKAIVIVYEWLNPIHTVITRSFSLISNAKRHLIDESQFREKWPDLLGEVSKRDIPPHLQAFFPKNIYNLAHQIEEILDDVFFWAITEIEEDCLDVLNSQFDKLTQASNLLKELSKSLDEEMLKTFN